MQRSGFDNDYESLDLGVDHAVPEPRRDSFGNDVGRFGEPGGVARLDFIS
jgi:hypothetical protein